MEMAVIMLRLDKYLADMQVGTRSEVKQMIRKGLVTVDGLIVKKPEEKVDCEKQVVVCSGAIVSYHQYEYYMLNKPAGVDLLSPKKHVDKKYYAKIEGTVTEEDVELFGKGVDIGEKRVTLPAVLTILSSGEESEITLTIREGKFHQVKRMFEAVGKKVTYLKRLSMGSLVLDEKLLPGEYRKLTEQELTQLKQMR